MPMLLHCSGIATKGYGCNQVCGQFMFDDAKRAAQKFQPRSNCPRCERFFAGAYSALVMAARFVRADPEAGTIPCRRQFLVADRHRRVHM
jgi:hypothetical protein